MLGGVTEENNGDVELIQDNRIVGASLDVYGLFFLFTGLLFGVTKEWESFEDKRGGNKCDSSLSSVIRFDALHRKGPTVVTFLSLIGVSGGVGVNFFSLSLLITLFSLETLKESFFILFQLPGSCSNRHPNVLTELTSLISN